MENSKLHPESSSEEFRALQSGMPVHITTGSVGRYRENLAELERLAYFSRHSLKLTGAELVDMLQAWSDKKSMDVKAALVMAIAEHVEAAYLAHDATT